MRFAIAFFSATSICAASGCAAVLGLDSGNDVADFADAEAGTNPATSDAALDAAEVDAGADAAKGADATPPKDSGPPPPVCGPGTANCDGNNANGCETMINTPQHCGSCTEVCNTFQVCMAMRCCLNMNIFCEANTDCCSNRCGPDNKCAGP